MKYFICLTFFVFAPSCNAMNGGNTVIESEQKKRNFSFTNLVSMFKNAGKSCYNFVFPLLTGSFVYETYPSIKSCYNSVFPLPTDSFVYETYLSIPPEIVIQQRLHAAKEEFLSKKASSLPDKLKLIRDWQGKRAIIALTAGNLMSEQDKLENLVPDKYWEDRKKIIKKMVDVDHVNPTMITYQYNTNPLYEAFIFKDILFAQYLLNNGAKPDAAWKKHYSVSKPDFVAWFSQLTQTPLTLTNGYSSKTTNSPHQPVLTLVDTCYSKAVENLCITADESRRRAVIKQFEEVCKDLVAQIKAATPDKLKQFDQEYITSQLKKPSECPICWDHFSDHFSGSKAGAEYILSCNHSLCTTCFAQCQTTCPICRKKVD